jgi:uncharacterized protein (TIGR03067 family)
MTEAEPLLQEVAAMCRFLSCVVLLCLWSDTLTSAAEPGEKEIVRDWTLTEMELGGKVQKESSGKWTFNGSVLTMRADDGPDVEFQYELRPGKSPPQIDLYANAKAGKLTLKGIYKLDGDKLVLCVVAASQDRPTEFKTTKDNGAVMFTLTKRKP